MLYRKDCKCHLCDPVEPAGQPNKMSEMIEMLNGNGFWPTGLYVFDSKARGNAGIKSQAINEQ